jgi:hypothetical protein
LEVYISQTSMESTEDLEMEPFVSHKGKGDDDDDA